MRRMKRAFLSPWLQLYSQRTQLKNISLQITHRQHKYMHVLQLLLQTVLVAFNRTWTCNVTWWSSIFSKNFNLILSFQFWKVRGWKYRHTYVHTYIHLYMHTYILPSSEAGVSLLLLPAASCPPGFLLSWSFITEAGVCPQADISTSTHQVSTASLLWHPCSRWCKWPGTKVWFIAKTKLPDCWLVWQETEIAVAKKNDCELSFVWWLWTCPCLKIISNLFKQIK